MRWRPLIFWPAVVVIIFGLLQYFALPSDFLKHFGYNASTIFPYETINHNLRYIRVMSSLRGANPLGAYLLLIISLSGAVFLKSRQLRYFWLGLAGFVVLILSFSRAAWIGLVISVAVLLWFGWQAGRRWLLLGLGVLIILAGAAALSLRSNTTFQNAFLHTQTHSAERISSNHGHITALHKSVQALAHQPLGGGPGSAGPASVHNTGHPVKIAEDFFVQISQEIGWPGLAFFLAINILLGRSLWQRRQDPLAFGLLAALLGLSFVNLLSHAWADETLAYIFWGLAALATQNNRSIKAHEKYK